MDSSLLPGREVLPCRGSLGGPSRGSWTRTLPCITGAVGGRGQVRRSDVDLPMGHSVPGVCGTHPTPRATQCRHGSPLSLQPTWPVVVLPPSLVEGAFAAVTAQA